jgi:hypothetical protein
MADAFDTLGYAKRLRDARISMEQAEVHAEAAPDFIMTELTTKPDLIAVRQDMAVMRREIRTAMDNLALRLTDRLGGMLAVSVAILAAIIKL